MTRQSTRRPAQYQRIRTTCIAIQLLLMLAACNRSSDNSQNEFTRGNTKLDTSEHGEQLPSGNLQSTDRESTVDINAAGKLFDGIQQRISEYPHLKQLDRAKLVSQIGELSTYADLSPRAIMALRFLFLQEPSVNIKLDILDELANVKNGDALDAIMQGINSNQSVDVRRATILRLQFIGDKRALPALYSLRSDLDPRTRQLCETVIDQLEGQQN